MFFVLDGTLLYGQLHDNVSTRDLVNDFKVIRNKEWVCEASLWMNWIHRGEFRAATNCRVLKVNADKFATITSQHQIVYLAAKRYAAAFIRSLQEACENFDDESNTMVFSDVMFETETVGEIALSAFAPILGRSPSTGKNSGRKSHRNT